MRIFVDGGCRHNGQLGSIGACAAVFKSPDGTILDSYGNCLPYDPRPTSQRAELTAIILALQKVVDKDDTLPNNPWLDVKIYSDSYYAVSCMREWIHNWRRNGWINAAGNSVMNQDLIRWADELDDEIQKLGSVEYCWIPREQNQHADRFVNEIMDAHRQGQHFYGCDTLGCLTEYRS
ncbi:hypothetical protein V494_01628 [Pseudogymnoascus sp. VKM F-4513 (FW-928)]|nr:hypothetical protein V494_01628 [Pseudogymnoascus sp. VKM F-4513 (FW-928)]